MEPINKTCPVCKTNIEDKNIAKYVHEKKYKCERCHKIDVMKNKVKREGKK